MRGNGDISMEAMRAHLDTVYAPAGPLLRPLVSLLLLCLPHAVPPVLLSCRSFIGFRPGDPTAGPPPATMPAPGVPQPRGLTTVDLRQTTMAELHAQAAATQPRDVFAALLPNPPGAAPLGPTAGSAAATRHAGSANCLAIKLPLPPAGAPPGRIAYVSGREPSAGQKKAQEAQQQQQQQQPQQQKQQKQQKQRQQPSAPG